MPLDQFSKLVETAYGGDCKSVPVALQALQDRCLIVTSDRMIPDWVVLDMSWLIDRLFRAVLDPLTAADAHARCTRTEVAQLLRLHNHATPELTSDLLAMLSDRFQLKFKEPLTDKPAAGRVGPAGFRMGPEYRLRAISGKYPQLIKPRKTPQKHQLSSPTRGPAASDSIRTLDEVHALLPPEYFELKQMMDMHCELKSQMASNRSKIAEYKDVEDDGSDVSALLREQASHVVSLMKDVLVRMEAYPEELWALYGTLEAYEGGLTENASQDDMMELYSQILVYSAAFLAVSKADPQ